MARYRCYHRWLGYRDCYSGLCHQLHMLRLPMLQRVLFMLELLLSLGQASQQVSQVLR